jgi:hypothetical protein
VTRGRVSSRRAWVLASISSQLLHSNRAAQKEADSKPVEIIFDLPRPKLDWPEGSERAFYERMARCHQKRMESRGGSTGATASTPESPQ